MFLIYLWIAVTLRGRPARLLVRPAVPACRRRHCHRRAALLADRRVGCADRHRRPDRCRTRHGHDHRHPIRPRDALGTERPRAPRLRRKLAHPRAPHGEGHEHRCTHRRVRHRIRHPPRRSLLPFIGFIAWVLVCIYGIGASPKRPGELVEVATPTRRQSRRRPRATTPPPEDAVTVARFNDNAFAR